MEYADDLERRSNVEEILTVCRNCAHSWKYHFSIEGAPIPCDAEDETICLCENYEPMASADVLENTNSEEI